MSMTISRRAALSLLGGASAATLIGHPAKADAWAAVDTGSRPSAN